MKSTLTTKETLILGEILERTVAGSLSLLEQTWTWAKWVSNIHVSLLIRYKSRRVPVVLPVADLQGRWVWSPSPMQFKYVFS